MSERIPLVPLCPACGASLPYAGAAHALVAGCPPAQGSIPSDPVEYAVFEAYASYPSLFGRSPWSRWYIFEHLFFVTGCGHEWLGGALIDVCREEPRDRAPVVLDARGELNKQRTWAASHLPAPYAERAEAEELAAIERSWARFERQPQRYYPLSAYANILQVPVAAEPGWLLAACDATRMFLRGQPEGQSRRQLLALLRVQAKLFAGLGLPLPALDDPRMTGEILAEKERGRDAHAVPGETVTALVEQAASSIALYMADPGEARDLSPLSAARQQLDRALEICRERARLLGSVIDARSDPDRLALERLNTLWPLLVGSDEE
jgi:hypothetical protein